MSEATLTSLVKDGGDRDAISHSAVEQRGDLPSKLCGRRNELVVSRQEARS